MKRKGKVIGEITAIGINLISSELFHNEGEILTIAFLTLMG